jgi:hypothetical protein
MPIPNDAVSYRLGTAFAGEYSSYNVSFATGIPVESGSSDCYVRYGFPAEMDASRMDLDDI